ncbi:MAG: putative AlkP superfamily pyrophosphatase or phosphodiesterase [Rhodothermales bacterium]|jgi:predicted AlkP superfamily pyrophosphatase or phosphodiesterase
MTTRSSPSSGTVVFAGLTTVVVVSIIAFMYVMLAEDEPAVTQVTSPKVLLIGLDGVRVDRLMAVNTPSIDALAANGTFSTVAQTRMPTVSGPGWSSMVTGVWSDKHGVLGNNFSANDYARYPDFLARLEMHDPSRETIAFLDWPPLGTAAEGGPMISDLVDVKLNVNGDSLGYALGDAQVCELSESFLRDSSVDAAFVYLGNIDVAGHDTGSFSPEYTRAIEWADACVGRLVAALEARAEAHLEDWLILMSTDHGRTPEGGHGGDSPEELSIFYLASGASASKGTPGEPPAIVDIAVTALTHLGVPVQAGWGLDGRVVGLDR